MNLKNGYDYHYLSEADYALLADALVGTGYEVRQFGFIHVTTAGPNTPVGYYAPAAPINGSEFTDEDESCYLTDFDSYSFGPIIDSIQGFYEG